MAKDLPYFKFFCSEWSDGDITLESYEVQGLFINICSYYWSNNCEMTFTKLKKKFKDSDFLLEELIYSGAIKVVDDIVCINFLNEQLTEREYSSTQRSKAGKASAEARKLTKSQHEFNESSTEIQHVLNSRSTESQLLREEKIREEKIREEKIREEETKEDNHLFNEFWNLYDKKVGSKSKIEKKFNGLKLDIQNKVIETLPLFLKQFSDKKYQPYPETYLNNERWNDELGNLVNTSKESLPSNVYRNSSGLLKMKTPF